MGAVVPTSIRNLCSNFKKQMVLDIALSRLSVHLDGVYVVTLLSALAIT